MPIDTDWINYFFYGSLAFLSLLGLIYLVYYWRSKKRLFRRQSLRSQINNIVTIALFSAISTTILIFFSKLNNIVLIPAVRVSFEGILVKISGFTFGPTIGLISAFVTELAVITFVPVYFHYKYLLVLMASGFFAGLIKLLRQTSLSDWKATLMLYLGIMCFAFLTVLFFFFSVNYDNWNNANWNQLITKFYQAFFKTFSLQTFLFWFDLVLFCFLLVIIGGLYLVRSRNTFILRFANQNRSALLSVLCLTVFTEYLVSVFIATSANRSAFGENLNSASFLFTSALALAPFKIIFNTVVIFTIYRILVAFRPNLKI